MDRNRKKHKFSLPVTVTVGIALALVFYLALSYFLGGYRSDIYDRIIDSNISALKETTSTLISKTTEGFDHCRHEIRVLGIGMSEELKFDPKTGRPLNNNLLDYKLSTMMDHPHLEAQFVENAEPTNPYGTKALGEPPACSGAPAIRNAILNATGIDIDVAPITPHVLFAAFEKAGLFEKEETAHV